MSAFCEIIAVALPKMISVGFIASLDIKKYFVIATIVEKHYRNFNF